MAQDRSTNGGLPDLDRITNRAQLAAALRTVKGDHSYRWLTTAARKLVTSASAERTPGRRSRWTPEPLTRGSVSDWLHRRGLPTRNKLFTFMAVCGVPDAQWNAWVEAVARVKAAAPGRTIAEHDPLRLGVHPAIDVGPGRASGEGDLAVLTPYVVRDHDHWLREVLRAGRGNQLVVLTGGSSVGKTRACYEAVAAELPGWPVLHPATAEELLEVLDGEVTAGTVLWLNEMQRYLQLPDGRAVAVALRRLLDRPAGIDGGRMVVLGSIWTTPYWVDFTRQPQHGGSDEKPEVRDLLTRPGVRIRVAEDFSEVTAEQLADLHRLAERDARLAAAVAAGGESCRVSQGVAGGPLLVEHYTDLRHTDPAAYAVLTAAMDARRIGYESPLPLTLLEQAAPGYLTVAQRAASDEWLSSALAHAEEEIHGIRPLTKIRTAAGIGHPDACVLQDYLAQHALGPRRRDPIPASLWDAVTRHARDPADLGRLWLQADVRDLKFYGLLIERALAEAGDRFGQARLSALLADRGDDAAVAELWSRADRGDVPAASRLAWLLMSLDDEAGASAAIAVLQAHADLGDGLATLRLAELLTYRGDRVGALAVVWAQADRGDELAAEALADLLAQRGDDEAVAELLVRSHDESAAFKLAELLVQRGDEAGLRTQADAGNRFAASGLCELLTTRGDEEAVAELRARSNGGDRSAMSHLAWLLEQLGDEAGAIALRRVLADADSDFDERVLTKLLVSQGDEEAVAELRARADAGKALAAARLAAVLASQGDQEAMAELRARADADDGFAASRLAEVLAGRGDEEAIAELWARTDAGDKDASFRLADLLVEQGDESGAIAMLRARVDAGNRWAVRRLADLLAQQGAVQEAIALLQGRADRGDEVAARRLAVLLARWYGPGGLRQELNAGNTHDAAEMLIGIYSEEDPEARRQLDWFGLGPDGMPASPWWPDPTAPQ
ncbi:MAG: hypothetical protein ACRDRO_23855 [Pseudonocardiaceae bacterium]